MSEPVVRIEIVAYDPRWPVLFEAEHAQIVAALGDMIDHLEHIGSTSVPGLAAKPIIDLLATVSHLDTPEVYAERLAGLGYAFFSVLGTADRYTFGKGIPHTHHLHIVAHGGEEHERLIAFRDYLRAHPETTQRYEALKRSLAERYRNNRQAYSQAKTEFIQSIEGLVRGPATE
jgi:GrpB-like predicted nucleotidyltransferase (UPF0157 family)